MKGTQRRRDLRVGKSGEHATLLARQHFRRPQQLDQDDFEQVIWAGLRGCGCGAGDW
jgi:hypothetical protein